MFQCLNYEIKPEDSVASSDEYTLTVFFPSIPTQCTPADVKQKMIRWEKTLASDANEKLTPLVNAPLKNRFWFLNSDVTQEQMFTDVVVLFMLSKVSFADNSIRQEATGDRMKSTRFLMV